MLVSKYCEIHEIFTETDNNRQLKSAGRDNIQHVFTAALHHN